MERKHVYYSLLLLESAFLIYMSLQSAVPTVPAFLLRQGDLEHLIAYAIYGFLLERSLLHLGVKRHRLMLAMLLGLAFAALTETIQLFVPARAADVLDWAIDAIGVGFGAAFRNKQFKGLS